MLQSRRQRNILERWLSSETKVLRFADIESEEHILYVQGYTRILAEHYAGIFPKARMTAEKISRIVRAAGLHDIGKLAVPEMILVKDGRLSDGEMDILKTHTLKGCEMFHILGETEDAEYNRICHNIILYHHEKYDGTGYPYGLKKDKIPPEAQLLGLADMYDVLIHGKGERQKFTKEEAYRMLMHDEFGEISPRMKECFQDAKDDMEALIIEVNDCEDSIRIQD